MLIFSVFSIYIYHLQRYFFVVITSNASCQEPFHMVDSITTNLFIVPVEIKLYISLMIGVTWNFSWLLLKTRNFVSRKQKRVSLNVPIHFEVCCLCLLCYLFSLVCVYLGWVSGHSDQCCVLNGSRAIRWVEPRLMTWR